MDLNPCYAPVMYENNGLEPCVRSLAVDMKLCNNILHGTLGTIVDHVVKMRLYDWRRTQNCAVFFVFFYKKPVEAGLGAL